MNVEIGIDGDRDRDKCPLGSVLREKLDFYSTLSHLSSHTDPVK